jgi:hypothetical protein
MTDPERHGLPDVARGPIRRSGGWRDEELQRAGHAADARRQRSMTLREVSRRWFAARMAESIMSTRLLWMPGRRSAGARAIAVSLPNVTPRTHRAPRRKVCRHPDTPIGQLMTDAPSANPRKPAVRRTRHQLAVRNAWMMVIGFLIIAGFWGGFIYYGLTR